jgi:hypothetical protein
MKQGFTLTEEKDPKKRLRNLQKSRSEIWERVIVLLDQGQIITHEIDELIKQTKEVDEQ